MRAHAQFPVPVVKLTVRSASWALLRMTVGCHLSSGASADAEKEGSVGQGILHVCEGQHPAGLV